MPIVLDPGEDPDPIPELPMLRGVEAFIPCKLQRVADQLVRHACKLRRETPMRSTRATRQSRV